MKANRNYKDSLFRMVFERKEDLLSLYNALNGTHYTDPDRITVNTLEDVVYMEMKNDISFILDSSLTLYEHQSTQNANMPLRDLFYISRLLQGIVKDEDIYREKLIKIPTPRFAVLYNGADDMPDDMELRLSDAFEIHEDSPSLELMVRVINVNEGRNPQLMASCSKLNEYARFVGLVRRYRDEKSSLDEAMEAAIDDAVRNGILVEILTKRRAQVSDWILSVYDKEKHMKTIREDAYEDGRTQGMSQGRLEAVVEMVSSGACTLENGAKTAGVSADELSRMVKL